MPKIRRSRPDETRRIIEIWRNAVDATHEFLTPEDRQTLDDVVSHFFPKVSFWLAVDGNDYPLGFMLIENGHMEALFVDPAHRGSGIGAALVRHGLAMHPQMTTDVNEQNGQAVGFLRENGLFADGAIGLRRAGQAIPADPPETCGWFSELDHFSVAPKR